MKNIILQHFTGELGELEKLSIENIKHYSQLIQAEYRFIEGQVFRKDMTEPIQKIFMLDESLDEYDNVVMLDIDMFAPKGMTKNVFDQPGIGLHGPIQTRLHKRLVATYPDISSLSYPYWGGAIYKFDRTSRKKLRSALVSDTAWMYNYNKRYHWGDEGILHSLAVKTGFNPKDPYMDHKWCQCSFLPNPENSYFIHIRTKITPSGPKREKIENYRALVDKGIIDAD